LMGTSELVGKIRADGRGRVDAIERERDGVLAEVADKRANEERELREEYRKRIEHETHLIRERAHSRARLERRKALLAARWEVIDRVLELAKQQIIEDPGYIRVVRSMIRKHTPDGAVVHLSATDKQRVGKRLKAKLGKPVQIGGGMLIQAEKRLLDFSLDESQAAIRDEMAGELARLLFPEARSTKPARSG